MTLGKVQVLNKLLATKTRDEDNDPSTKRRTLDSFPARIPEVDQYPKDATVETTISGLTTNEEGMEWTDACIGNEDVNPFEGIYAGFHYLFETRLLSASTPANHCLRCR
jgi:hypothetical protein